MISNAWFDKQAVQREKERESENLRDALCKALSQRQVQATERARPFRCDSIIDRINDILPGNKQKFLKQHPNLVASGRTIKQLIMVPFHNRRLDMLAHRVGNTIYVDHLELPGNQNDSKSFDQPARRNDLAEAFIASCVSNVDTKIEETWQGLTQSQEDIWDLSNAVALMNLQAIISSSSSMKQTWPRPRSLSYRISTEGENNSMHLWEFSNLRMLIDHEIPMLSGENLPSVSIRFNDERPISILTGMDIWLDHMIKGLDGVVVVHREKGRQKDFQVHLTSEIPALKGSEFDPSELATVIENIYKFLDDKMTEQGHTYYLHRVENSNDLTLYDMTAMFPDLASNTECNPSLSIVACALMKQANDLLNDDDPPSTTAIEIAYKMIQSAKSIINEDRMPHVAASLSYLRAALYQCVPLNLNKEKFALSSKRSNNLFGLESILIERTPQMSSSVPVDALRSALNVIEDDEEKASTAIRCIVPGIESGKQCIFNALTAIDQGLKFLSIVEERRKRAKQEKFPQIPVFAVGKDDENTLQKERKKSRVGTDVELLKALLHLRAIVGYHSASLIYFESEGDTKLLMSQPAPEQFSQNAFLFELCRVAFANCAEVMRLESSSRTRIAATVQVASLFRIYMLVILNLSHLSLEELSEKLAEVRCNEVFLKQEICKVIIPDSNVLKILVDVGEETITDKKSLDEWMLNVGNKFRTLLTKYTKEYEQLETKLFKGNFDLTSIRCSIALSMMQCGERHREEGTQEGNEQLIMEHFRSAIHFYEIGSKHLDMVIQAALEESKKVDVMTWELQIALRHNEAAMRRGLVLLEIDSLKNGKKIEQSIREVLFTYITLENFIDKQNLDDFPMKIQQKANVISDTISFMHRCYFYYVNRPGGKTGTQKTSRESHCLEESLVGAKRLWALSPNLQQDLITQIKTRISTMISEMLLHNGYLILIALINEGFSQDDCTLLKKRIEKISGFSRKSLNSNLPLNLSEMCLTFLRALINACNTVKVQGSDRRALLTLLNVLIELVVMLPNCSISPLTLETELQSLYNDSCVSLQQYLLGVLSQKGTSSNQLNESEKKTVKTIADLVIRRPSASSLDWKLSARTWTKSISAEWLSF
ncbi:unnamed protein product, partial [Mesorhabditis belari]|uniref:EDRF1 N-terminal domain-containing protein n=1 Tax=Mesorhabditis belari TaxID=2138241 RepID=A0AAF3FN21_9BILA